MRFCEYMRLLHSYIGSEKTQADFMIYITDLFMKEAMTPGEKQMEESGEYNPLDKLKARSLERIYTAEGNHKISKSNARILLSKYYPGLFEEELTYFDYETQNRFIAGLKSYGIKARSNNYEKIASKVYYKLLEALVAGKDSIDVINEQANTLKQEKSSKEVELNLDIKRFMINHGDELSILPLCQIADNVNPMRKHSRQMYNDYLLLPENVKSGVLKLNNVEVFTFDNDWVNSSLAKLAEDLEKYSILGTRKILYDGAKYINRSLYYSANEIDNIDPYIIKVPLQSPTLVHLIKRDYTYISIGEYIKRYLEKEDENMAVPLELLWVIAHLSKCSQEMMCFWTMRFIISSCVEMSFYEDKTAEFFEEYNIETMEDMYYYTLLQLYLRYYNRP